MGVSEGFIQEVIFDWALKISAISKVARKGKGMAQKGSSIEKHINTGCEWSQNAGMPGDGFGM